MLKMRCFFFLIFANFFIFITGTALSQPLSIDLDKAFELALESHENIKAAESDVAKAGEGRHQARGSRSVTLKVEHSTSRTDYQIHGIALNSFQNVFSATYPLYTGGMITGSIAASEYELSSKILSLERAYQDVRLAVETAFFTMLRTENMAELAGDSVERLGAHVHNVDVQFRNGNVNKADLLRSEVELINARQSMSQAVNEYEVAIKSLNDVMGLPLDTELIFDREMSYSVFPHTLDECIEYALSFHPDIAIADLSKKKAEAGIVIEESSNKPRVTLSASQTLGSELVWPGFEKDNLQVAIRAEYTFWDGGVTNSKIRGAREDLKKAGYNYESARDTVVLNVTKYFLTMEEALSRIETGAMAVDFAQEAYRIALARYREGVGTNIDILDAQTALNQSSSNHTQALCDYNIAVAQLVNAMGIPVTFEDN